MKKLNILCNKISFLNNLSLPKAGIVCSNPRRAERIVNTHLESVTLIDDHDSAWPLDIWIGNHQGKSIFVSAAGSAFAFAQFAAAGATHILRYGSNDDPTLTESDVDKFILVDSADNLYGLMQGSRAPA